MYELIGSSHRSGSTVFYDEPDAAWFRENKCAIMLLKGSPVRQGSCKVVSVNPEAFSKTGEALVSLNGQYAVIL